MEIWEDDRFWVQVKVEDRFLHATATQEYIKEISIAGLKNKNKSSVYRIYISDPASQSNIHSLNEAKPVIRGIQLMYDGTILEIGPNGKINSIVNLPEIAEQWNILSGLLLDDNEGDETEAYLKRRGETLQEQDKALRGLRPFSELGLLFLEVPGKNEIFNTASRDREIRLNNETLIIREEWVRDKEQPDSDNECIFRVSGMLVDYPENEGLNLISYSGFVRFNYEYSHSVEAEIRLEFENKRKKYSRKVTYNLNRQ